MSTFKKYILMAAGFAVLAVVISGFTASPVLAALVKYALIRDVDNPTQQPTTLTFTNTLPAGDAAISVSSLAVPAGKRLVIEYVNLHATSSSAGAITTFSCATTVNSTTSTYYIPVTATSASGTFDYVSTQLVRFYADAGTTVTCNASRPAPVANDTLLTMSYSGYYVNFP